MVTVLVCNLAFIKGKGKKFSRVFFHKHRWKMQKSLCDPCEHAYISTMKAVLFSLGAWPDVFLKCKQTFQQPNQDFSSVTDYLLLLGQCITHSDYSVISVFCLRENLESATRVIPQPTVKAHTRPRHCLMSFQIKQARQVKNRKNARLLPYSYIHSLRQKEKNLTHLKTIQL